MKTPKVCQFFVIKKFTSQKSVYYPLDELLFSQPIDIFPSEVNTNPVTRHLCFWEVKTVLSTLMAKWGDFFFLK